MVQPAKASGTNVHTGTQTNSVKTFQHLYIICFICFMHEKSSYNNKEHVFLRGFFLHYITLIYFVKCVFRYRYIKMKRNPLSGFLYLISKINVAAEYTVRVYKHY